MGKQTIDRLTADGGLKRFGCVQTNNTQPEEGGSLGPVVHLKVTHRPVQPGVNNSVWIVTHVTVQGMLVMHEFC